MADKTKSAALVTVRVRAKRSKSGIVTVRIVNKQIFLKISNLKKFKTKNAISVTVSEKDQNIGSQGFKESNNFSKILNFIKKIQMADLTKMLSQNMYT